jgi:hypothetical protein
VGPLLATARLLDVQAIVVDGDLPRALVERLAGRVAVLLAEASPEARDPPALRVGTAGRDAPAMGAAILPLHLSYGPTQQILFGQPQQQQH